MSDPLDGTRWADWTETPIAGDASARSYTRLVGPNDETVVVMDSGPVETTPFCDIARYLTDNGLCAPEVLMNRHPHLVLSDLGTVDVAHALDAGEDPSVLYAAATDVLIHLRRLTPPPLQKLTPEIAGDMVRITAEHYAPDADSDLLATTMQDHMARLAPDATTLALRDYHVENLIWRPTAVGLSRIGLLDFQDAFIAPEGYDLVSLLRDIRRPVPVDIVTEMTQRYCAATGRDAQDFAPQLACLGAQRNLRILGVFARLIRLDGKPKYTALMPRVWDNLMLDLKHPAMTDLRNTVLSQLPPPDKAGFA